MTARTLSVTLSCPVATSFRATKAANSLDIDQAKKSTHTLTIVAADLDTPYQVGLIVGASGSGKTTLAAQVFGQDVFRTVLKPTEPVIDQFPAGFTYDECAEMLAGVGLTSVPCWIRPAHTLSNGQKARAECALQLARSVDETGTVAIDEWTSVVDRTVAKVMSHCVQKHARRSGKRIVLLSCHYDVHDWLNPDWVIDCNAQSYTDRRAESRHFIRSEKLHFEIRPVGRESWRYFSKYHYLSDRLPGGIIFCYGLFLGDTQIGFQCLANYVPVTPGTQMKLHSNRTVIHPDYAGMGLGIKLATECARIGHAMGHAIYAKFSSVPMFRARANHPDWRLVSVDRVTKVAVTGSMKRESGWRKDVKTWTFRYLPSPDHPPGVPVASPGAPVASP